MKTLHKIIIGDSRKMDEVSDESVQLVITSPPYWQLKDYGATNQIGYNNNYEDYINNLNIVWNECYRVLENGCRLCINIGDQFARSVFYGRYKIIPIRTEIIRFCETIGFDYMGAIIWQKVTTTNTTGGATVMGSFPYPRNGVVKIDYEFILLFKKNGQAKKVSKEIKELSRLTKEEWNEYFYGHWNFAGERQDKHLAMFPEELPKRLIKMFSYVGDTILDPFLGSGTTSLAAKNNLRNSIGYEINKDFEAIIQEKIGFHKKELFHEHEFDFIEKENLQVDYSFYFKKLPYIFRDPVKLSRKVNPKKNSYGSKIDNNLSKSLNILKVKEILSPCMVLLSNGKRFRLLGIDEEPSKSVKAIEFLSKGVLGKKVFLKFDTFQYDEQDQLIGYLYLENKTLVNLHLIKSNLVNVNYDFDYKYQVKFKSIAEG